MTCTGADLRTYPTRPYLAVSAAIFRAGQVLIVRRGTPPMHGVFTLPGGVVEVGETLEQAVIREVREETGLAIEPVALAGYREVIARDAEGKIERHFVVASFVARWVSGEGRPGAEAGKVIWARPDEIGGLATTSGLARIAARAFRLMEANALAGKVRREHM